MSVLTAPTVVEITIPAIATITTTLPSGYNIASASTALASLTSVLAVEASSAAAAAAATATGHHSNFNNDPWSFTPSFAVALVAVILYAIVTVLLIGRMAQYKAWWMTALVIGGAMETMGFGARARNTIDLDNSSLYKMQLCCTILAPIFTAAAEYILLGRLMGYVGRRFSLLKPGLVAWIFIISDAISFLIQVGGAAALLARPNNATTPAEIQNAQNLLNLGDNILLAGLAVNLASFAVFCVQIFFFHYRTRRDGAPKAQWHTLLYAMYVSSFLVLVRQVYRVIEFSQGWFGYLPTHEAYFYGLDSLPILIASAIYIWFWPNKYIPGDKHLRLAEDGNEWREMTKKEKKAFEAQGGTSEDSVEVRGPGAVV